MKKLDDNYIMDKLYPPSSPQTDPADDLSNFLNEKERDIRQYAQKPTHNPSLLKKYIMEHEALNGILDKMTQQHLYQVFCLIDEIIVDVVCKGDEHGVVVTIPCRPGPTSPERYRYIDLSK